MALGRSHLATRAGSSLPEILFSLLVHTSVPDDPFVRLGLADAKTFFAVCEFLCKLERVIGVERDILAIGLHPLAVEVYINNPRATAIEFKSCLSTTAVFAGNDYPIFAKVAAAENVRAGGSGDALNLSFKKLKRENLAHFFFGYRGVFENFGQRLTIFNSE